MVQFQQHTTQATVGTLTYIDDDNEEFLAGGSPTITTTGQNAINRVDTVTTPNLGTEDFTAGDVISITVGANSLSHTLTAGEAADITSASGVGKSQNSDTPVDAASDAGASLTFSGVGNDLRVTFDTAGVNTDSVSQPY